jgi:two-component system sensor histidine kinase HydH
MFLILIILSALFITYLHYSTLPQIHELHNVYAELYYLPILMGALVFGLRGSLLTYAGVSALYIPYIYLNWTGGFSFAANKLSHAFFSGMIAVIAGFLSDREKKLRIQSEKDHYLTSLGRASAAIVHDLRSPLITVAGFAKRINEEKGDIKEESQLIVNAARKMQLIVNDAMDFAKPVTLDVHPEDMGSVIKNACESCAAKAREKEIDIVADVPPDPLLPVDGLKMERALVNLINNAIDASFIGGRVSVDAEVTHDRLEIRIRDTGTGMDRETLENIFIPFYTKKSSGTGLGMAIAKKIVEAHEGQIHITSQEQTGTEVNIKLPVKPA